MHSSAPVPFVVLSTARSGTSLLVETLHSHPQVYCHGEIFHECVAWHIRDEYRNTHDLGLREQDPIRFTYSILSFVPGDQSAVGFKIWRFQSEEVCDALLQDGSVRKIIMERENRLAQYSSDRLARITGVWNLGPGSNVSALRAAKSDFSRQSFLHYVNTYDALYSYYEKAAVGEVIRVSYGEIAALKFDRVFQLLGVAPIPVIAAKEQLHSSDILSRYEESARDEILSVLRELGKSEWTEERG